MRILIDLRCCQAPPPRGGVARYAEEAVRALLAMSRLPTTDYRLPQTEFLLFANGLRDPRRHLPTFNGPNVRWIITRWPNMLLNPAYALRLTPYAFRDADVIWLPNLNFLPRFPPRTRLVVTVHDLSFEHFPDLFTPKQRLWHRLVRPRALLARADAVVAVSATTKRDLMEIYGLPEQKVHVVYPGVMEGRAEVFSEGLSPPAPPPHGMGRGGNAGRGPFSSIPAAPFILSLAEAHPRKNLDGLVAAFERLPTTDYRLPQVHLVIAGKHGSATRSLERQIARSPLRDRIHLLGPVSEDEKTALLARAHVFAYPSFWEGFGFPPLEAMAASVPVVASTGGSLPEVLGDAALLTDPLDPAAIAHALHRACTDDALRTTLITNGHARVAWYRWETTGEQLLAILTATT